MDLTALKNVAQSNITALTALQAQVASVLAQHQSTLTEIEQIENTPPTLADIAAMVAKMQAAHA